MSTKILEEPFALISVSTLKMEAVCYSKTLAPALIYTAVRTSNLTGGRAQNPIILC